MATPTTGMPTTAYQNLEKLGEILFYQAAKAAEADSALAAVEYFEKIGFLTPESK